MRCIRVLEARGESSILSILIQIKAENMSEEIRKHPLNVVGKYYVEHQNCLDHELCLELAPNNFKMDESYCAYVFKQPETAEEEAQCKEALEGCPVEAIRDDG